MPASGAQKR